MSWNNDKHWPDCYRTQREAQIPEGDFREEVRPKHWLFLSLLFAVFVLGGAVSDLLAYLGI